MSIRNICLRNGTLFAEWEVHTVAASGVKIDDIIRVRK